MKKGDEIRYFGTSIILYFSVGFTQFNEEKDAIEFVTKEKYSYSETPDECVTVHFTNGRMVSLDELKQILKR